MFAVELKPVSFKPWVMIQTCQLGLCSLIFGRMSFYIKKKKKKKQQTNKQNKQKKTTEIWKEVFHFLSILNPYII